GRDPALPPGTECRGDRVGPRRDHRDGENTTVPRAPKSSHEAGTFSRGGEFGMTESMESKLARLPEPAPPAALAATVMARIARAPAHDSATADRRARRPETESILGGLWAFIGAVLVGV